MCVSSASFGGREVLSSLRIQFLSTYDKLTFVTSRQILFETVPRSEVFFHVL